MLFTTIRKLSRSWTSRVREAWTPSSYPTACASWCASRLAPREERGRVGPWGAWAAVCSSAVPPAQAEDAARHELLSVSVGLLRKSMRSFAAEMIGLACIASTAGRLPVAMAGMWSAPPPCKVRVIPSAQTRVSSCQHTRRIPDPREAHARPSLIALAQMQRGFPCSQRLGAQSFDPPIVLSVADFEQLLLQGGIEQQDEASRAVMDCSVFVTCLRQQVWGGVQLRCKLSGMCLLEQA